MNTLLGVIVPAFNEEESVFDSGKRLQKKLQQLTTDQLISPQSFILFIDDGSSDKTWQHFQTLHKENTNIFKAIKLSKNCGHQKALLSGLHYVEGKVDIAISIDIDLQQDINAMDEFIKQYHQGYDIVYGVRVNRESDAFFKKLSALSFYTLMKWGGVEIIKNHADYRLLSRKVLKVVKEFKEYNLFLRGILLNIGFRKVAVYHQVFKRELGSSKYSITKMLSLAADGITSFSIAPIRLITIVGAFVFLFSFCMIAYILLMKFKGHVVPGWASTLIPIYFIGGVQLISLGVVGEYIGKIYMETKARPPYIIEDIIAGP
ncbi:MAG: glycosyltransferase family 2 protein [Oligoflexia bacterium]|nr:glycosyltransferase family 2 protein [Oligoflexia bacterium]